jgi:hypothetical protein
MGQATSLKRRAEATMERLRRRQIDEAGSGMRVFSEKELLLLVRGVTRHVVELLYNAGYRTVRELGAEEDVDRLAIKTGLGIRRAKTIREGVVEYLRDESARVEEGQAIAQERAVAQEAAAKQATAEETGGSAEAADTGDAAAKPGAKQLAERTAEASLASITENNDLGELKV